MKKITPVEIFIIVIVLIFLGFYIIPKMMLSYEQKCYGRIQTNAAMMTSKVLAEFSDLIVIGKVTNLKTTSRTNSSITLSWKKISGVSGYEIYRSTSKNKNYKKIATINNSKNTFKDSSLSKNKTYYYKVRAYKTSNGKKVYGSYSSVKSMSSR